MNIDAQLKEAVEEGIGMAMTDTVQNIVIKETRRALLQHEDEITEWIRTAVRAALEEAFKP